MYSISENIKTLDKKCMDLGYEGLSKFTGFNYETDKRILCYYFNGTELKTDWVLK